jgi:hypothetical protein
MPENGRSGGINQAIRIGGGNQAVGSRPIDHAISGMGDLVGTHPPLALPKPAERNSAGVAESRMQWPTLLADVHEVLDQAWLGRGSSRT